MAPVHAMTRFFHASATQNDEAWIDRQMEMPFPAKETAFVKRKTSCCLLHPKLGNPETSMPSGFQDAQR
jgi:hypothetical protein